MTSHLAGHIAVLGTASDVGKSLIATALCRLLADAGRPPAPFKAQNMSLQSGVAPGPEGGEMSRAQILQAHAARLAPHVDMNPVLLKPTSERDAEVVVLGRALDRGRSASAREHFDPARAAALAEVADAALDRLLARRPRPTIVLEGAGSPVELNLMDRDFVNLRPARRLGAAIVLVADIDRGGVFAQVKGTLDLLPAEDRRRVLGVIVNRFRGDPSLFADGITTLERIADCPVLAVVPFLRHGLDEEDRPLHLPVDAPPVAGALNVAVVLHPHVANTDDVAPLAAEPDVAATWVTHPNARAGGLAGRDLLILPGSKATVADLHHHTASGLAGAIAAIAATEDAPFVLGLCAGYQMLGRALIDPGGTDGPPGTWPGLGLLDVETTFAADKHLADAVFTSTWPRPGHALAGYEIHRGRTRGDGAPLVAGAGAEVGVVARGGRVVGAYLHGLLSSDAWRADYLTAVRAARGLPPRPPTITDPLDLRIDRWSRHVASAWRPGAWERVLAACGG
jgi:adenosylcobyric acid synthase